MTNETGNGIFYPDCAANVKIRENAEKKEKQQSGKEVGKSMEGDSSPLSGAVIIIAGLLVLDFCLSLFGAAIQSAGEFEINQKLEEKNRDSKWILSLKNQPSALIHAIWLMKTLLCVSTGLGFAFFVPSLAWWKKALVILPLIYLFSYSMPYYLGRSRAAAIAAGMETGIHRILTVSYPFTLVSAFISEICARMFGVNPKKPENEVTEDEIISMVNEGHEQGVLDKSEAEMIQNIFEMDDKQAQDIMTHRKSMIGISASDNLRNAIAFMVEQSVSRFPVYEESIDNIIGILHFKDAMKMHTMQQYEDWLVKDIPGLLREVRYIPETRGISLLFKNMQAEKIQMVIVVDEYGQTAGLVTMEDILEEIVGNIQDEYDDDIEYIQQEADGSYCMDGMTPLEEAGEILGIEFEEEYDTMNGFLISRLDRILSDDERPEIEEYGYRFRILEVENKMIKRVQIQKLNLEGEQTQIEEQEKKE